MANKIQKTREIIEKRYEYWREKELNSHSIESEIRMSECQHLLLMLNSLQEESKNDDLEEAAKRYGTEGDEISGLYIIYEEVEAFKAGAEWQKARNQETIETAIHHAYHNGRLEMKEQMMKEAIDGYVIEDIEEGNGDFLLSCEYLPKNMGLADQQKVKVIVIKED